MDDRVLRRQVVDLLSGGHAHTSLDRAAAGLDPALRGARPAPHLHSVYELLEHVRIAQEDILRYTLDPGWRSPAWPEGYWPASAEPSDRQWASTLERLKVDLAEVVALVSDPARDLTALIPHGEGRTYLRQALLLADHNAYHVGQVVFVRKLLGAWSDTRP
jgi:uncharacterized damage-inducible protein DinB